MRVSTSESRDEVLQGGVGVPRSLCGVVLLVKSTTSHVFKNQLILLKRHQLQTSDRCRNLTPSSCCDGRVGLAVRTKAGCNTLICHTWECLGVDGCWSHIVAQNLLFDLKDVPNLSSLCLIVHKQSMCILKLGSGEQQGSGFEVMPG